MSTPQLIALESAINLAGSQAELARRLSTPEKPVRQQHVWNWLNRDKKVPAEWVLSIEVAVADDDGTVRVSRHALRPDIYPAEKVA